MLNLFLDANIWLDLYHFSNDDLNQFGKLSDMINKDIKLYVNSHLHDEVARNRDAKIKDAYTKFKQYSLDIPNLCKGYPQYLKLKEIIKSLKLVHSELCEAINQDIEKEELHADKTIKRLFEESANIEVSVALVEKAKERFDVGNPPGKDRSYGDAINWESLLYGVPNGGDLFLVSSDKDYRSPINETKINTFLLHEWKSHKHSEVYFYPSLTQFLAKHLKDIELKTELEKDGLIKTLAGSGNFAITHSLIAQLGVFTSFTDDQLDRLLYAAVHNGQVGHIIDDPDLYGFYRKQITDRVDKFSSNPEYAQILQKLGLFEVKEIEDPFQPAF